MRRRLRTGVLALVVPTLLTACGAEVHVGTTKPDTLDGATIAARANAQLAKENPSIARGELTCADVPFKVGATARCVRTVVLEDGRLVRIGATVTIDKVTGGGHFKVRVDDKPQEFGLTGASVFKVLSTRYAAKYGGKAPTGGCPAYLAGKVGTTMTCRLTFPDGNLAVLVTVTRVDARSFGTGYTYKTVR
jgi:uncharacterized protein DUF4333